MPVMTVDDYIDLKLTHSCHTSERKSFRGCRRRWDWVSRQFYYPQITAKPLEFGTAYHYALETYYQPATWSSNPDKRQVIANAAIMAFKSKTLEQLAEYKKRHGNEGMIDPGVEEDYKERVELGIGMLRYHLFEIAPMADEDLTPKYVEVGFEVPITGSQGEELWCTCDTCWGRWTNSEAGLKYIQEDLVERKEHTNCPCTDLEELTSESLGALDGYRENHWKGLPVTYGGRIDCLMEGPDGRLWVFDWKTAAQLSKNNDEFLLLEDQIVSYVWALRYKLGINVAGFIWHEQKKGYPQEPEPMKIRRKGCMFSVSKSQDTNYEVYKKTVEENDPDGYLSGAYDEFLTYLLEREQESMVVHGQNFTAGNAFYQRYQVVKSDAELQSAGQMIYEEAADMTDPKLRIYPNPGRFHCGGCAFKEPCKAQNNGEDYVYALDTLYEKRTRHYWETAPATTDKPSMGGVA